MKKELLLIPILMIAFSDTVFSRLKDHSIKTYKGQRAIASVDVNDKVSKQECLREFYLEEPKYTLDKKEAKGTHTFNKKNFCK